MNRKCTSPRVGRVFLCVALILGVCANESALAQKGKKGGRASASRSGRGHASGAGAGAAQKCNEDHPSVETIFSGLTYKGELKYQGSKGPATLEVTTGPAGEQTFILTPLNGGEPIKGRLTAQTTCKYTGVTLMLGELTQRDPNVPPPPPAPAFSLRACRRKPGIALRSKQADVFEFIADEGGGEPSGPSGPGEWGKCYGKDRLSGDRPL